MVFTSPIKAAEQFENVTKQQTPVSDNFEGERVQNVERLTPQQQYAMNLRAIDELVARMHLNLADAGVPMHLVLGGFTDAQTTDREKYPMYVNVHEKHALT